MASSSGLAARRSRLDPWLASSVGVHLVISFAYGYAHDNGHVALTTAQSLFVYIIILAGPIAGLALSFVARRPGALLVAVTMAAALIFGVFNHFVIDAADHVSHVVAEWQPLFGSTALLLAISEAVGVFAGFRAAKAAAMAS